MRRLDDGLFEVGAARSEAYVERDGHRLWFSDSGEVAEVPLLLIHGGPGGRSSPLYRRLVDGRTWRIVQFDQRGCGQSLPPPNVARTDQNSLAYTLSDIEAIRERLGVERWVVAGGSWGSTVALAYAQAYPKRCMGLLLVSTWLLRRADIEWWFHGVRTVFPELWHAFSKLADPDQRGDLRSAYHQMIFGQDAVLAERACRALFAYEEGFMHAEAPFAPLEIGAAQNYAQIFIHYAINDFFLREGQLLEDAHRVAHLPAMLVSGRYDMCTPVCNAWDLAARLNNAELQVIPGAGHYPTEPALAQACARASKELRNRL